MKKFTRLDDSALAKAVKRELTARGISDVAVADHMGLTKQSVGQWFEKGKIPPGRHAEMAELLGVAIEQLLAGDFNKVDSGRPRLDISQLSETELASVVKAAFPSLSPDARKALICDLVNDL